MKSWKPLIAGFLVVCLLPFAPHPSVFSEEYESYEDYEDYEGSDEEIEEDPIPESYYYTIESNQTAGWPQGPMIESAAAVVMDMDTGVYMYSKNAEAVMYPASTTKIMTALLAVENCDLDADITFSEIVYDLEDGSSHLGIQPGEKMNLRDAVYGLMLASANDIANGLAEYMGGSLSGFADMMNAKAEELGCINTHFANPHGLYQEDHYTCAHDMALIAKAAYDNPIFREIVTSRWYTIPETNMTEEERSFLNHHKMMQEEEEYYRSWCTGGKTGFTSDSLNTLVTYAEKDEKNLVSVVFRVNGAGKAYNESTQILEYAMDNFYTEVSSKVNSEQTFYDVMKLNYLGESSNLQSDIWKQQPCSVCSVKLTLPYDVSSENLNVQETAEKGKKVILSYDYNGYPVGTSEGQFRNFLGPVQTLCQKKTDVIVSSQAVSSDVSSLNQSMDQVLTKMSDVFEDGYQIFAEYTENHSFVVIISGIIVLIILLIIIIALIFRNTAESRRKRRRKQEEKERRKREDEIDRMTTEEIEAELRKVMEEDRLRKEQERLAQEEAERAAEYERQMEEKAHETERLIEELEKERQKKMASKQ